MKSDFFTEVLVPDFIKLIFENEDWYLYIKEFINILDKYIIENQIKSQNESLKVKGKVIICKDCKIDENVVIHGPVFIGKRVEISPGAFIRPGSIISDDCSIGHCAEIKNSLMMKGSKISNQTFLGDSIIGSRARMAGHSKVANRRFDQKPISFVYKDKKIETGMDKLGMILGEQSRLGGGVSIFPGSMIGKNTFISTGITTGGYIPINKFLKAKVDYEIRDNNFKGNLKKSW